MIEITINRLCKDVGRHHRFVAPHEHLNKKIKKTTKERPIELLSSVLLESIEIKMWGISWLACVASELWKKVISQQICYRSDWNRRYKGRSLWFEGKRRNCLRLTFWKIYSGELKIKLFHYNYATFTETVWEEKKQRRTLSQRLKVNGSLTFLQ